MPSNGSGGRGRRFGFTNQPIYLVVLCLSQDSNSKADTLWHVFQETQITRPKKADPRKAPYCSKVSKLYYLPKTFSDNITIDTQAIEVNISATENFWGIAKEKSEYIYIYIIYEPWVIVIVLIQLLPPAPLLWHRHPTYHGPKHEDETRHCICICSTVVSAVIPELESSSVSSLQATLATPAFPSAHRRRLTERTFYQQFGPGK